MKYKIVVDSACDLTPDMKTWDNLTVVPLTLQLGDYIISDDENFDQDDFIGRIAASGELPKSACPSPEAFKNACEGDEEDVYIITITDKLSGCYNSAVQGVSFFKEENESVKKNIHVFNSRATSGVETLMVQKIKELADAGTAFEDVVKAVEDYEENHCGLYFNLESLDALKGNGRLFTLAAKVIEAVRIKLVCSRTKEGTISVAGKDLTENRALSKLVGFIARDAEGCDLSSKECVITHVCCEEKANKIAGMVKSQCGFGKVTVLKCSGLNSLYASRGGVIVSFER